MNEPIEGSPGHPLRRRSAKLGISILVLVGGVSFADSTGVSNGDDTRLDLNLDSVEGLVIASGLILRPPFEFQGLRADTLRINGIPLLPTRTSEKSVARTEPGGAQTFKEDAARRAFQSDFDEKRRGILSSDPSWRQKTLAALESSIHVEAVEAEPQLVRVKFDFRDDFEIFMLAPPQPEISLEQRTAHEQVSKRERAEQVADALSAGCVVAFGDGYFHIFDKASGESVVRILAEAASGRPVNMERIADTGVRGMAADVIADATQVIRE